MNRQKSITRIGELLARFSNEVKILNSSGLYDINIHAENVLVPLINEIYGLNVSNANYAEEKNVAAIDLVDYDNRVAFQVTSTADNEKVKHTLSQFVKYERYKQFDTLFIYIISEKQPSYTGKGHAEIIGQHFSFEKAEHIIDHTGLFKEINSIMSLAKIRAIEKLLEDEFTEEKIEQRKNTAVQPESSFTEKVYPNILELELPGHLYIAELNVDREAVIKQSWETEYKLKMKTAPRNVVRKAIGFMELPYTRDFHISSNQLITFRNLHDPNETLRAVVDPGTITVLNTQEYYMINDDHKKIFTGLLNNCLEELLHHKGILPVYDEGVFRFRPGKIINTRSVKWKKTNNATRKVVFDILDKTKQMITGYRHFAFSAQLHLFDDNWFVSINPSWSFSGNGYSKSNLGQYLMAGLKRLENNKTIYYAFRFVAFCLNNQIQEEEPYPYLIIKDAEFGTMTTNYNLTRNIAEDELAVIDTDNTIIIDNDNTIVYEY